MVSSLEDYINKDKIRLTQKKFIPPPRPDLIADKNAIYMSIQIYKHLWIDNHYVFYMKIVLKENPEMIAYSMKRYSVILMLFFRILKS